MPNTPGTVLFPGGLDDADSLIRSANNAATTLTVTASSTDNTLTVASFAAFPPTGALSVDGEVIFYTGTNSSGSVNTFTGCIRGQDGTTATTHSVGALVELLIVSAFHTTHSNALIAVETKLGNTPSGDSSTASDGTLLQGATSGTSSWTNDVYIGGLLGVGATPSDTRIVNVAGTLDDTSNLQAGIWVAPSWASATTHDLYGINNSPSFDTTDNTATQSTINTLLCAPSVGSGAKSAVTNFNNLNLDFHNNSTDAHAIVTTYRGILLQNPAGLGTIHNAYGLYIENINKGDTTNYALYSAGGNVYFDGNTGIGDTPEDYIQLNLRASFSDPSATQSYGINTIITANPSSDPPGNWSVWGRFTNLTQNGSYDTTNLVGERMVVNYAGTGTITNHTGIIVTPTCALTSGTAASTNVTGGTFGVQKSNSSNWNVTTMKVVEVQAPDVISGTLSGTNLYGLYLGDYSASIGTWTHKYALYVSGGDSYHADNFGIGTTSPNSPLHVAGPIATAVTSVTGNTTLTAAHSVVLASNSSSSDLTITLPTAVGITGRQYLIKKINAHNSYNVHVATTSSQTINGAGSVDLANQWDQVRVVSDGSNWVSV